MDASAPTLGKLSPDGRTVAQAMALLWTWQASSSVHALLGYLGSQTTAGKPFSHIAVKQAWKELQRKGLLGESHYRQDQGRLTNSVRAAVYRELLEHKPVTTLRDALHRTLNFDRTRTQGWPLWDANATIAVLRLEILSGASAAELDALRLRIEPRMNWDQAIYAACLESFDPALMARIPPAWQWAIAEYALEQFCQHWDVALRDVYQWLQEQPAAVLRTMPLYPRLHMAEVLLHRGDIPQMLDLLATVEDPMATALRAGAMVQQGCWAEAQPLFETALKGLQTELGVRKHLLPDSIAWLYPLCLLAQQTSKHIEQARKFCIGESGSRQPSPQDPWGAWVHAIDVRLGNTALTVQAFFWPPDVPWATLWFSLLRAWVGPESMTPITEKRALERRQKTIAAMHERLQGCGFSWLDAQLTAAEAVFQGGDAPAHFFVSGGQESWRTVLLSLEALGTETATDQTPVARLVWSVQLSAEGALEMIQPMEQKRGPRGWGKPKPVSLAKMASNNRLEPWDAQVARAIQARRHHARNYFLDRAAAMVALIGHPAVVMADALDTPVDVLSGTPEIEVTREGDHYTLSVTPKFRPETPCPAQDEDEKREREALRFISVVRDSAQRIRVIQFTPAQRRAVQLMSSQMAIPATAQTELQQALHALAGHFHIQSDHATAARDITAESLLRAELSPAGDGLMLRLVVAPLGPEGPRLMPGSGHAQVMAAVKGETLGALRDLAAEQAHLEPVLDALPFLNPLGRGDVGCEWVVEDPESALAMVEVLPTLPGIAAVDWPRGKAVRVLTLETRQLGVQITTGRDWFAVKGRAEVEEGLVLDLEALLAAAAGNSRFVPMGQGLYIALTRDLRERLADLAAVVEQRSTGLRAPTLAASWLDDILKGTSTTADQGFHDKIERLRNAQDAVPALPAGLQADLRPYQEDGYVWAMRLAEAGFGACLADDMGLGKTLQSLAVMLARAGAGPALVIAPTSVCGNWRAEIVRFAPTLNPLIYGEGDREGLITAAGSHDVVIVSYTLMQQAHQAFSGRAWHTLIVDEAQAIKNAIAKRSLAIFQIPADFRMALSGTPVENRLAELWSIMRFCNPGLLGPLNRFNERFAAPIERDRNRDAQRLLRRLIGPFVLRRTKAQVLDDLPPRTELVLSLSLEGEEAAHYEALRRQAVIAAESALDQGGGQAHFHILAQLTRLRRAACDPRLVSPDLGIVGAKVRTFTDLAGELSANGHKALVFSQFVDFLTLLRAPLDAAGISYQYLDGATPVAERERRIAAFQAGEGDLFLISLKAGGFGLNLTAADYVIITDPWWNPAAEDQAMGRAHRIGQLRPVTVYRLVAQGTLEEQIIALHHDKRALAEGVLADGGEVALLPSSADLLALMRGK